jgi:hypothetical protein
MTAFVLFGTLTEAIDTESDADRVTVDVGVAGETVGDALDALTRAHPSLEPLVRNSKGKLRAHIVLRRNSQDVRDGEWVETLLSPDDQLELEPGTKGGC